MENNKTLKLTYTAIFSVIIAVCAWITIPTTVPFTMQTFGVALALFMLGGNLGTVAILVYICLGAVGAPVFAGFKGGFGVLFQTTGGYIFGFIFMAIIYLLATKFMPKKPLVKIISMVVGLFVCYAFGTAWFMNLYAKNTGDIGLMTALSWCVIPFIIPDLLKIALAFGVSTKLKPLMKLK